MQASEAFAESQAAPALLAGAPDLFLDPQSEHVSLGGRIVGQAVTLGRRVQFFSDQTWLAELDGRIFDDLEAIRRALKRALSPRIGAPGLAGAGPRAR
ncbi:MAG: hypothetical protein WD341_16065 [Tistlia sp.]|uniref:hypothetical protein n=1 Tax=Tistlia sp. TaxID=3057121 RepID=UPI0034A1B2CB